MTQEVAATAPPMRRLGFASVAGTALEYYDFAAYNTLAALVFNKLFFPTFDATAGTLLSFATFWVGYLSRPVGGVLFGHLGDRRGRRFVLMVTLLLMGVSTVLIGLLPTYAQIGAWAPVLLVSLRFIQGVALGGEWAGAVLLSLEHGAEGQRGRNASFAQMGPSVGTVMAFAVVALTQGWLTDEQQISWGWRVPLLASIVLVPFGIWSRARVTAIPRIGTALRAGTRTPRPGVARTWARVAGVRGCAPRTGRHVLLLRGFLDQLCHADPGPAALRRARGEGRNFRR